MPNLGFPYTAEVKLKKAVMTAIEDAVDAGVTPDRVEAVIRSLLSQSEPDSKDLGYHA